MSACSTNWDPNYLHGDMMLSRVSANFNDVPNGFY